MKLLKNKKLHYSIVTYVKVITIDPLFITPEVIARNIRILTDYGETLDLVLYADQKSNLELFVPLRDEDWASSR